jgi:predicted permease
MTLIAHNVRYAIRAFARTPGFTTAALLSLALGIGANTAIFSVASALLLRPLPYADADRLVILWNRSPGLGITEDWFSTAQYFDIRQSHHGFEQLAIAIGGNENLTGGGEPERVGTIRVSSNLLPMLGARVEVGRLFTSEDDVPGGPGHVVLGHGTWMRRFGGDPRVIGRPITLNGRPYEVIGVLAAAFDLPREVMPTLGGAEHAEVVLPLPLAAEAARVRNGEDYNLVGKLNAGVSIEDAQAEMDAITARLRKDHPDFYPPNGGLTFSIVPLHAQVVGDVRRPILILLAAVGFVLLIACANVANLMLSRALGRQREIAVRQALGAGRARIAWQLLTESVLLALGGGALGVLLARWSVAGIRVLGAMSVPRLREIAVGGDVLLYTLVVSVGCGVLFGLAPIARVGRIDVHDQLASGARGSASGALWGRGQSFRHALVVAELALSVALLIGAGLLLRSFAGIQRVSPGFNPRDVLTLELSMAGRKYADAAKVLETYKQLWSRLNGIPGVVAAGGVSSLPLSNIMAWGPITVEGRQAAAGEKFINVDIRNVAGSYFRAMEIPLRKGRLFDDHDTLSSARVIVVDEYMAAQLWPGQDPIGKRVRTGGFDATATTPWMTVVGVVGRIKQDSLDSEPRMAMYRAHTQFPGRSMNVVLRSASGPAQLAALVRDEIRRVDQELPLYRVRTMTDRVDESLARRRFSMLLLVLFAGLALVLASVGVYSVISFLVDQGTRELGIRIALGASPRENLLLVLRHGAMLTATGISVGLLGAFVLTKLMRGLLFEVSPSDPATFAIIGLLLAAVALAACLVPARRAAKVDPIVAIRSE